MLTTEQNSLGEEVTRTKRGDQQAAMNVVCQGGQNTNSHRKINYQHGLFLSPQATYKEPNKKDIKHSKVSMVSN